VIQIRNAPPDKGSVHCFLSVSKWHLQRMFKKETGHSLGQYIRSRKLTEIAQKLKIKDRFIAFFQFLGNFRQLAAANILT
jgi:AraC-like DNA-binding protein